MSSGNSDSSGIDWVRFESPRHGFSFIYPDHWDVLRGVSGLLVSVVAPDGDAGGFRSNLNVVRRVRDTSLDLDGLAESSVSSLLRLLTEPIVVDVDSDVIANQPARRLLIAYRQGLYALSSEQWLWLDDDHIWTISAAALTEKWDAGADAFSRIAHSFTLEQS